MGTSLQRIGYVSQTQGTDVIIVLSSLGGVAAFVTMCWMVIRAMIQNVNAVSDNTKALARVEKVLVSLDTRLVSLDTRVDQNTIDIAILQDRSRRR